MSVELHLVVARAEAWWHSRRPVGKTRDWHIEHAAVNCHDPAEVDLARAIARLLTAERAETTGQSPRS